MKTVQDHPGVQDETEKRAADVYAKIDGAHDLTVTAKEIVRDAMDGGASTAEDFAKAFEQAGFKSDLATAAGSLVDSHFKLAAADRAVEGERVRGRLRQNVLHDSISRLARPEWLLITCLALALLVAPWRFSFARRGAAPLHESASYSLIFLQPAAKERWFAEIDTTRYVLQVFAVGALCGAVYLLLRRGRP
jgi:hypothetical protein